LNRRQMIKFSSRSRVSECGEDSKPGLGVKHRYQRDQPDRMLTFSSGRSVIRTLGKIDCRLVRTLVVGFPIVPGVS
jgi:hypothetical protein